MASGTVYYEEELRESFLEYSMSVITSRALPDVRDGLKPVQRRVLYAMFREGHTFDSRYTKCAGIVGEVLKRYHPHGDSSVYDTLVRLAQSWVLRYPLVDGQGNFGSVDGDSPAAYRYTEARLSEISSYLLSDIKKDTVSFGPNYNNSDFEPLVFPTRVPQLLVNGSTGIAVGMATNIPPHNLDEVVQACTHVLDNPGCEIKDLLQFVKGPDFPTGGLILGKKEFKDGYLTGRGTVKMRGVVDIEELPNGREAIVITALPYNVNKARLIERIADLVKTRKLDGIQELRDESDQKGMRIFIGLKKGEHSNVITEKLYQLTPLQSNFAMNMVCLVGGRPKQVNLKDLVVEFLNHRKEVVRRRALFELKEARKRAHILEGLKIIVEFKDEYLKKILPASKDKPSLKETIEDRFKFTHEQSEAIVILPNYRFSGLEIKKIVEEYEEVKREIKSLEELLSSEKKLVALIKSELEEIRQKFPDKRRTKVVADEEKVEADELIPDDPCFVTMTAQGYLKRLTPEAETGGESDRSRAVKIAEDVVVQTISSSLQSTILAFFSDGVVYSMKAHQLPNMRRYAKGTAISELLGLKPEAEGETPARLKRVLHVKDFNDAKSFVLVTTRNGVMKKIPLTELAAIRRSGLTLLRPGKRDEILDALIVTDQTKLFGLTVDARVFVMQANVLPVFSKGVGTGFTFAKLGDAIAGLMPLSAYAAVVTADGHFEVFNTKDYLGGTPEKPLKVKSLARYQSIHLAPAVKESEIIIVTLKAEPQVMALTKAPGGTQEKIDMKKSDEIVGMYALHPLSDQLSLDV